MIKIIMFDVLSVGNANMDFIINGNKLPNKETVPLVLPGGSASNFAVGCAKLKLKTGFAGFVGRDYFSEQIFNNFKKHGIKTFIKRVNKPTGIVLIFTKGKFKKMIRYIGANECLRSFDLRPYANKTKHLHLASPPLSLLKYLKHFKSTSVDPKGSICMVKFEKLKPYFKHIDVFLPNRLEIERICGCKYTKAAKMIIDAGCKLVVVKRRWHGCYATDGNEKIKLKPFPIKTFHTTGAGEAFGSAFINAWLRGLDLKTACLHGLASAHKTISSIGSQDSATMREIKAIIKRYS